MGLKKEKSLPLQTESSASEETAIFTNNYRAVGQRISSKTAAGPQRRCFYCARGVWRRPDLTRRDIGSLSWKIRRSHQIVKRKKGLHIESSRYQKL